MGFLKTETLAAFYRQGFGFTRFEVIRCDVDGAFVRRSVDCTFPVALEGALQSLLRSEFRFVEDGEFERATATWRYRWIPSLLPAKLDIRGWIRTEDVIGESRCRRRGELDFVAAVPVLGAAIERAAARVISASWDRSAVELGAWVQQGRWG